MINAADLARKLQNGDEEAVQSLIDLYGDQLLRTACTITGDLQVAEEAVQDTLLQVCRKISAFHGQSSLKTWIFRILINTAKNSLRHSWFRRVTPMETEQLCRTRALAGNDPELLAIRQESINEIIACLNKLPGKYRETLTLYYLEDFSIADISQILALPEGTVKSNLFRARTKFKEQLQEKGVDY